MKWYAISEIDTNQIYFPTLRISDARSVKRLRKYGPIDTDFFWFLYPHQVEYQQALKVTISCSMDFQDYPFDSHVCSLDFGASSSISERLQLRYVFLPEIKISKSLRNFGNMQKI